MTEIHGVDQLTQDTETLCAPATEERIETVGREETDEIQLSFQSKSQNERFSRTVVAAFVARLDPTLEELGDIKTAVSEAVTNAIVHAYPEELGKIQMKARIFENRELELQIRDWGRGIVDVEQARLPLFTTGGEERSGMGFTVMESFMDQLKVRSKPGQGTVVTMKRRISRRMGRRP